MGVLDLHTLFSISLTVPCQYPFQPREFLVQFQLRGVHGQGAVMVRVDSQRRRLTTLASSLRVWGLESLGEENQLWFSVDVQLLKSRDFCEGRGFDFQVLAADFLLILPACNRSNK